jgi:hypothetical protein
MMDNLTTAGWKGERKMSQIETVIAGTLNADGTLDLDRKPNLPPGRVTVVLRQESGEKSVVAENWFEFMQATRKKMAVAGCHFMAEKEMQEHLDWLREGDRIDDLLHAEKQLGKSLE